MEVPAPSAEKPTAKQNSARTSCFARHWDMLRSSLTAKRLETLSSCSGSAGVDFVAKVIGGVITVMEASEIGFRGLLGELGLMNLLGVGRGRIAVKGERGDGNRNGGGCECE